MSRRHSQRAIKKPLRVEYMQWNGFVTDTGQIDGYSVDDILVWVADNGGRAYCQHYAKPYLYIITLEGEMQVEPGDYVVRGVIGEFYPVKPEAFEAGFDRETA